MDRQHDVSRLWAAFRWAIFGALVFGEERRGISGSKPSALSISTATSTLVVSQRFNKLRCSWTCHDEFLLSFVLFRPLPRAVMTALLDDGNNHDGRK